MTGCKHEFVRNFCDANCRCLLCGHTESFESAAEAWNAGMGIATAAIAEKDRFIAELLKPHPPDLVEKQVAEITRQRNEIERLTKLCDLQADVIKKLNIPVMAMTGYRGGATS